jgi:hypothetical protein
MPTCFLRRFTPSRTRELPLSYSLRCLEFGNGYQTVCHQQRFARSQQIFPQSGIQHNFITASLSLAMSGLEVVGVFGVVAGIISAFHNSLSLYRSWKQKKKERRRNSKNESWELSLSLGETKIQGEYDFHFARLGQRFAVGDCES